MNLKKIMTVAVFSFVLASCGVPSLEEYKTKLVDAGYTVEIARADDGDGLGLLFEGRNIKEFLAASKTGTNFENFEIAFILNYESAADANEDYEELLDDAIGGYVAKNGTYIYSSNRTAFFDVIGVDYVTI
jgi:hypothetical protein